MEAHDAVRVIERITLPNISSVTAVALDDTNAASALAYGESLGDDTTDVQQLLTELASRNVIVVRYTSTAVSLTAGHMDEFRTGRYESSGLMDVTEYDSDQLIDRIMYDFMSMNQKYLREQFFVDGQPRYNPHTEAGNMAWDAYMMFSVQQPAIQVVSGCAPGCQHDHQEDQ